MVFERCVICKIGSSVLIEPEVIRINFKQRFQRDVSKYSFSNRVIDKWNQLPEDVP